MPTLAWSAHLEVFAGGNFLRLKFEHLASVHIQPPRRLRDLLWTPAHGSRRTGPERHAELGEVLLPALSPSAWHNPDDTIRLGRMTAWEEDEAGQALPIGPENAARGWGKNFQLLEVRELVFHLAQNPT